ncbi:Golgi membrane exchange factor (Ric1p-Rgp1p) subunit [Oleoguttula sp. CCFEE 5521]
MHDSLTTTKRKFHKLLDSINASSSTFPPPEGNASATAIPLTARQRLDAASERAKKRPRTSTSTTSLTSTFSTDIGRTSYAPASSLSRKILTPRSMASRKRDSKSEDQELPNFSPWSHEQFLARLKTFSKVSYWQPKPVPIGELKWAKQGWQCVDVNTVACKGGCERRVVVKLERAAMRGANGTTHSQEEDEGDDEEDTDADELENALVQRYADEITDGHAPHCMWRKAGCKDDIYRLSLVRPVIWQPALRARYVSLLNIADSIKDVTIHPLPREDPALLPPDQLADELPANVLSSPDADTVLRSTALDIALHGWRGDSELDIDLLHCDACFQRIGLWMYQPGYVPGRGILSAEENDVSEPEQATINLLEMHRMHCPWQNAASQAASGTFEGMNAGQILNRVVSTYAREQRRRSEQIGKEDEADVESTGLGSEAANDGDAVKKPSAAEIDKMDKERESKLRKLKRLFTVHRSSKVTAR